MAFLPTREELVAAYKEASAAVQEANECSNPARNKVLYKVLGDRIADYAYEELLADKQSCVVDEHGHLNANSIASAHALLFPPGFELAGQFRRHPAYISASFGTASSIVEIPDSQIDVAVAQPSQIETSLEELCDNWNSVVRMVVGKDISLVAAVLAEFHYEFVVIHPFTDGNGRLARLITKEQASHVLKRHVKPLFDRQEYYEALRLANLGRGSSFKEIIQRAIDN